MLGITISISYFVRLLNLGWAPKPYPSLRPSLCSLNKLIWVSRNKRISKIADFFLGCLRDLLNCRSYQRRLAIVTPVVALREAA
jgi:hypothetical protein